MQGVDKITYCAFSSHDPPTNSSYLQKCRRAGRYVRELSRGLEEAAWEDEERDLEEEGTPAEAGI